MNKNIFLIFLIFNFVTCFSQDEFIEKYENKISDFNLKIKSIANDTLTYKAFGKTKKIALCELYGYRFKKKDWVFIDSMHKKYGLVSKGKFELRYKRPEFILKPFYYGLKTEMIDFRFDYKIVFKIDSNKTRTLIDNRDITFRLQDDSLNATFICNLYKVINDTLVIKADYGFDSKNKYWKIPFNKISYIDFQTNAQKALKITSQIIFSTVTIGVSNIAGGTFMIPNGIKIKNKIDLNSNKNYEFIKREKIDW